MTPLKQGGAYVQYVAINADSVGLAPSSIPLADAATVPLAGLTALQGLRQHGALSAGMNVLIVGGAGGVGHFAVQIARAAGARVATISSARNFEWLQSLGATEALDYTDISIDNGPRRFDLIFDAVAVDTFFVVAPAASARRDIGNRESGHWQDFSVVRHAGLGCPSPPLVFCDPGQKRPRRTQAAYR